MAGRSPEDLEAILRGHEETLKVKERELEEKTKKINLLKYKLQSLQKQYVTKEGKDVKDSPSTPDSSSVERGRLILLKKQLDESRQLLEQKERENAELQERLKKLADSKTETMSQSEFSSERNPTETESLASFSSEKSQMDQDVENLFNQIVVKDNKILELNQRCMDLEKGILDLQESLREKDEVLKARNTAIKMMMKNQGDTGTIPPHGFDMPSNLKEQSDMIEKLKHKLAEVEFEKGNLQLRVMELEGNNGTRPPLLDVEIERDALKKENDEFKLKINDLIGKYDTLELEKERLEQNNHRLSSEMKQVQASYNSLEVKLSKLQEQLLLKDNVVYGHISSEKELKNLIDQLQQDVNDRDDQIVELQRQMSDLAMRSKSAIIEKENIIASLRMDLDKKEEGILSEKDEQIEELKNELEMKMFELMELQTHKSKESEEIQHLRNVLSTKETEISSLKKLVDETSHTLQQKVQECQNLLQHKTETEKLLAEKAAENKQSKNTSIENYEKELAFMKKEQDALVAKNRKLEQRLADILKQRDKSDTKAAELEEDKQELLQRVEELDKSNRDLQEQLRRHVEEITGLQLSATQAKTDLEQELRQKESKIQFLQEQAKSIVSDMQEMEKMIASKESLIEELTAKVHAPGSESVERDPSAYDELLQKVQELEHLLQAREETISSMSHEKLTLVEKVNQLREELQDMDSREEDLNHQQKKLLNELKESRQTLESELETVSEELQKTKAQLDEELKGKTDAIDMKLKLQQAESTIQKLQRDLEVLQSAKDDEVSSLKVKLAEVTVNSESIDRNIKERNEELERQTEELSKRCAQLERNYAALEESYQLCSDEKTKLEENCSFLDSKLSRLQEENNEFRENMSVLKASKDKEINILNLKLADFSSNWETLHNSFTEKVNSLSLQLNEVEKERNALHSSLEELQTRCKEYEDEKVKLVEVLSEKDRFIQELSARLSKSDSAHNFEAEAIEEYKKVHAEMKKITDAKDKEIEFLRKEIENLTSRIEMANAETEKIKLEYQKALESSSRESQLQSELKQSTRLMQELRDALDSKSQELEQLRFEKEEQNANFLKEMEALKGHFKSETAKYEDKCRQLSQHQEHAASEEVEACKRQIVMLEEKLNSAQLDAFNILADEQNKVHSLQSQIAALVNQLEFERNHAREAALLYEQRVKEATTSQQGTSELEAKYKGLATKFKLKERELNQLRNRLSIVEQEAAAEKNEELELARKKIADLESAAATYQQMLNEERIKMQQVEEEMEKLWRISKNQSSTNLMIDDSFDDETLPPLRSSRGYLSAIRNLSVRTARNWLQAGPPSRRFKRYVFLVYLFIIHIVLLKMCLF